MSRELRGELTKRGKTYGDIAILLHRSHSYVSRCASKCGFKMREAYKILDSMGIPHKEVSRVFPGGKDENCGVCEEKKHD